jgi:hypothetical protein
VQLTVSELLEQVSVHPAPGPASAPASEGYVVVTGISVGQLAPLPAAEV